MAVIKMSVHRALGELKTYDSKIEKAKKEKFIIANKKSNEKIGSKTIAEYGEELKGNLQKLKALIENRKRLKSAIVMSNAETIVKIADKNYCVAEAIERKNFIDTEENILVELKNQYIKEVNKVELENKALPQKLESYLSSILGDKAQRKVEEVEQYSKAFENKHKYELIDPNNISDYIKELEESITRFKTEVDYILSESNATTFIEVDFV